MDGRRLSLLQSAQVDGENKARFLDDLIIHGKFMMRRGAGTHICTTR